MLKVQHSFPSTSKPVDFMFATKGVDPRRGSELVAVIGATGEALQKKRRRNDETDAGERLEEPCSYFYCYCLALKSFTHVCAWWI